MFGLPGTVGHAAELHGLDYLFWHSSNIGAILRFSFVSPESYLPGAARSFFVGDIIISSGYSSNEMRLRPQIFWPSLLQSITTYFPR